MTKSLVLSKKRLAALLDCSEKTIDRRTRNKILPKPRRPDDDSPSIYWLRDEIEEHVKSWPVRG